MYDSWDEVLNRIEQEHGIEAMEQVSNLIDEGVISDILEEHECESLYL